MEYDINKYRGVMATVQMITPKMAAEMLTRNYNNRPISKRDVKKYVEEINAGTWEVTNQGIGFSKDGALKDGQHRLTAVVLANIAVPMLVVTGLENDTSMIDRNKIRSVSNVLIMGGMSADDANKKVVSAANALYKLVGVDHPSEAQIRKLIEKQSDLLLKATKAIRAGTQSPICDKAICSASAYCALKNGISDARIVRFFEVANSGFANGDYETAAIVFRNYLLAKPIVHGQKSVIDPVLVQCTNAIKDFCDNKSRRNVYKGDPVFFASVEDYFIKEIL